MAAIGGGADDCTIIGGRQNSWGAFGTTSDMEVNLCLSVRKPVTILDFENLVRLDVLTSRHRMSSPSQSKNYLPWLRRASQ